MKCYWCYSEHWEGCWWRSKILFIMSNNPWRQFKYTVHVYNTGKLHSINITSIIVERRPPQKRKKRGWVLQAGSYKYFNYITLQRCNIPISRYWCDRVIKVLANNVVIIFVVVFVLEAALIILGNAFTIFVFSTPTRTSHIRRTCYLLINLAVADLLVGITEPIILGMEKYHQMTATTSKPRGINGTNPLRENEKMLCEEYGYQQQCNFLHQVHRCFFSPWFPSSALLLC